tara:strand:- start:405 stop:563 length:159 start_codon:yes stop_codon:yes gene_type:complete
MPKQVTSIKKEAIKGETLFKIFSAEELLFVMLHYGHLSNHIGSLLEQFRALL